MMTGWKREKRWFPVKAEDTIISEEIDCSENSFCGRHRRVFSEIRLAKTERMIEMKKYTLKVDGMMCGMCEAHVNDAVRNAADVKKVTSSHSKGETVIIAEDGLDLEKVKGAIAETGYKILGETEEPYKKKFFGLF